MRLKDRRIFAEFLGVTVRADKVTHCRRPRFYWVSWATLVDWHYPLVAHGDHLELVLPNDPGPRRRWLSSDASWKNQEVDARLPSFFAVPPFEEATLQTHGH